MIKKIAWCVLSFTLFMPAFVLASTQTLTINWTLSDTTGISGYKMYYAYDAQMSGKSLACENNVSPATTTSLTCTFDVTTYPFYAQIAAVPTDGSQETVSIVQTIASAATPTISTVQGFALVPPPVDGSSPPLADYAINFQPADAVVPTGFIADNGSVFSDTSGYGWTTINSEARDRDNTASPDQSYDTLIHADPPDTWEFSLPNGSYSVTVCVGDPAWPNSTNYVQAEGSSIISNGVLSSTQLWIENTATINVTDGKLTLTFTGSSPQAKLCWVKITSI